MVSLRTPLCELIDLDVPIVQAPMGSASTPELAAAVANAGGLGMLAVTWLAPDQVGAQLARVKELTARTVGVNLCLDFDVAAQLDVCLEARVPVVSTFWGDPAPLRSAIRAAGAIHLHTVGTPDEARAAVDAGVDVVVAQGWEAGGHVWGEIASLALVPAVVDAVGATPVIAAGGVADGRGLAAVLALGAQGAWLGTRFLAATEAGAHDSYRARVVSASAGDAVHTRCFDGGWPDAPHRVLRNSTLDMWERHQRPPAPDRPGEGEVVARDAAGREHRRYSDLMPLAEHEGDLEAMALYAGQSVGLVHDVAPAGEIVAAVAAEASAVIEALARR